MSELELTVVEQINAEHHACEAAVNAALKHAIRCGALLEGQKADVGYGEWLGWLEQNFEGSVRVAQTYMRLSRNREVVKEIAKAQTSAHLSIDGALQALASPREPDALPAPSEASEDRDAALEYHKRKAREHAEAAEASWALAEKACNEALMWCRKFAEKYDALPDDLSPEARAKCDEMRGEMDALAEYAQAELDAGRELFGVALVGSP